MIDSKIVFPTLPLEIEEEHLAQVKQDIDKRWLVLKKSKHSFAKYSKNKSDSEIKEEFCKLHSLRQNLWYKNPASSPHISNKDYMVAQDLLAKGFYRRADNIAFAYNRTDSSYNASTILINGLHFIALQEPDKNTLNAFFKFLLNHRVSVLVRLKPKEEFINHSSIKYWEDRLIDNKLPISDYEALKPAIPYYFTDKWVDDKAISIEELYNLVQLVREVYKDLQGPIACRCASGIGRTGTFIAAFLLTEMIDKMQASAISIEEIVLKLSLQRPNMVANAEQYIVLYRFVNYLFHCQSLVVGKV
jgi:protein tyrosine phosphatase